jgi:hypothetical protein
LQEWAGAQERPSFLNLCFSGVGFDFNSSNVLGFIRFLKKNSARDRKKKSTVEDTVKQMNRIIPQASRAFFL